MLGHRRKVALIINHAHPAADSAAFSKRIAQAEADHAGWVIKEQLIMDQAIGFGTVEIVGVDNSKRGIDYLARGQHGMPGSPRLHSSLG